MASSILKKGFIITDSENSLSTLELFLPLFKDIFHSSKSVWRFFRLPVCETPECRHAQDIKCCCFVKSCWCHKGMHKASFGMGDPTIYSVAVFT